MADYSREDIEAAWGVIGSSPAWPAARELLMSVIQSVPSADVPSSALHDMTGERRLATRLIRLAEDISRARPVPGNRTDPGAHPDVSGIRPAARGGRSARLRAG
ncbi:hypothetical protein BLTE_13290 [Blastochloris tepida]|uniref:Uncharacterized protein n=1 Tax=Blastochloris tepida TaxID=2233851 RepID=A0A348FZB1_9HYPH|nr:hypothetical protein BLTE_13290 [Blastochloris tepida]